MNETYAIALCIKHGDPRGFEYLVEKYRREAMYHARGLLGNEADSADACQEAFAKAFAAIRRVPLLDKFYPWFYRILRNTCINMLSRRSTVYRHAERATRELGVTVHSKTPEFLLEKEEEQLIVWQALDNLKPEFREILIMKYIQGLNYAEISQILSIPRGTVMSRLYNARKAFRDSYLKTEKIDKDVNKEVRR